MVMILAERMSDQQKEKSIYWNSIRSIVLGAAVFSMHFISILAFHLISPLTYDSMFLLVSIFMAIFASFSSFYILQFKPVTILSFFFEIKEKHDSVSRKILQGIVFCLLFTAIHYLSLMSVLYAEQLYPGALQEIQPFTLAIIAMIIIIAILFAATYLAFLNSKRFVNERGLAAKLRQSEGRFRRLVELSPEPIVVHVDGNIAFLNEACFEMIGEVDKSELIGKSIMDYVPPNFKAIVKERMQGVEVGMKIPAMDQQIITPSGSVIDVEIIGVGIEFEGKLATQLVLRDITEKKKNRRELEENQQRYQSLFKQNPDGVYCMDATGQLMDINQSLEEILGYSLEDLSTMTFHAVVDPDHLEMTTQKFLRALEGTPQNYETVGIRENGDRIPLEITNLPIIINDKVTGVFGIAKDISKEKEALGLLEENEEKYRSLFDYNLDAVFEIDQTGIFTNANKMTEKLTGFTKSELLTMSFRSLVAKDLEMANVLFSTVLSGTPVTFEQVIRNKNGDLIEIDISSVPKRKKGMVNGIFAIVRDVTEKKQTQEKINELAFTDQLTGLSNRHWFYQNIRDIVQNAREHHIAIAVLLLDFDDFKGINDEFGHYGGDLFLKQVSDRIQACLRDKGTLSRVGGDEFIIVMENVTEAEVSKFADQILEEMKKPISLMNQKIVMSLSIGITTQQVCIHDEETLISQADIAMYSAKEKGKNNYQFYTGYLNEKVTRKLHMEKALRLALEQEEFQLYYQPQVDLQSKELVGLEALLRWNSPTGLVSPIEFIPLAEETGLITPIGEWVIRDACRQMKKWESEGCQKVKVSVNVSAKQFKDLNFASKVKLILEEEGIDPQYLEIEITESVMMDIQESALLIDELKKLGVKIAIDDFGAGYSSLNVIKNVEIDTLKIDKSLIDEVLSNPRNMFILAAIIDVGKNLNAEVVVEGIELEEQVIALKEFDVIGQGYFFSRPLRIDQLEQTWHKKILKS